MHMSKNPKIGIRVALSLYRDRMPWVYDEGIALLVKMDTAKTAAVYKKLFLEFEELLMISARNPFVEKFLLEEEEDYILISKLPRIILRGLEECCHLGITSQ